MKGFSNVIMVRWRRHERARFLVVGGWNTLFGYGCFVVLYSLLHERLHYLLIGLLAHAIAVVNSFACHRLLVFRSRGPLLNEFFRFNVAHLFVLGFGLVCLWLLVTTFQFNPLVGQAIVTSATVVLSYFAHRRFSFA